jgi:cytochrome P450
MTTTAARVAASPFPAGAVDAVDGGGLKGRALRAGEIFALQHSGLTAAFFAVLRHVKPIATIAETTIVTRQSDVHEVLSRDDAFTVGLYAPKMEAIAGRFILGMEHTPKYEHDVSVLRLAVPRSDLPRIAGIVDDIVSEVFADADAVGSLEVVGGLTDAVPARLSERYFGVPGPDERTLVMWGRAIFRELFFNIRNDPVITAPASAAAAALRQWVGGLIAARRETGPSTDGDDTLRRLLTMSAEPRFDIDDAWIRTYLIGLLIGMLPLTSKATALAIDALLDRPGPLAAAQAAARADDDELLAAYLSEAMRFAPQAPGQFRLAARDVTIAAGTRRETTIPAGARVFAATQSAMLDGTALKRPRGFRTDRPAYDYLHFGYGLHACFGRYISREVQMPAMFKALLRREDLRRAPGAAGRLAWRGPFPDRLHVRFARDGS